MQYKSIAAAFALFAAAAAMAIPAAAPAGVGALEARNWNWKQQYPDVKNWVAYKKPDGTWCEPYTEQYSYSYAYSVSSFVSYSYNTNHPKARNWDWKQQYPDVKSWLAYPKDNGK
ncbi:hypothetical protein CLAFUW4_05724 [Fulvia fulva]|uniref:Uncharacterized protein n=1 Tax=Passalora fulva TaxID=5499 RepID=A0A9Q8P916_PASFU|nr:uncharacterized protein CLAFUR5_05867 [Fulvia fulva]KAK4623808.1 hypothetical protein CLAFUR4_05718 [Fulvia fulva]KAK4625536.1 hypothetical protein CLAFUR0_05729 [Fulvia fulva]UJO17683.1 hypothetical protein CLAFUR5_05867 [Fulvia fulva]WPV15334.1 hypothetical protein CLAFUW4_05724 [Fulvia fulva]WPV29873.1 hypothetical protein CLAFUW7_05722 [Fulvia fulva]